MRLPSGDQTGPSSPRVWIERPGTASTYLPRPVARSTSRIWLSPSRNLAEYGFTAARAMVRPSGDQVGLPGSNVAVKTRRTSPLATSAVHSAPSWSRKAISLPLGDHAADTAALVPRSVSCRSRPVPRSLIQRSSVPPRSVEYASRFPSGDQAGSHFHQWSRVSGRGAWPIRVT
ncbi:hypothetical protein [Streptomyces sp. SAI-129]|uniref:hypothetical protein n=1 Tax=Streptomyces sp. SAI-129 TaxID=3377727 RepID=UPI003C7CF24F